MTWKTPASAHWALRVACQAQETETAPLCLTFKSRKVLPWPEGQRRYGVEFELTSCLEDGPQTTADSLQWEERTPLRRPTWRCRAFLRQGARPMPHAPWDSARPTGLLLPLIHSLIFGPSFPERSLIVRWVRKTKCTKQEPVCVWGQEKGGAGGKKRAGREAVIAPATVRSACIPPWPAQESRALWAPPCREESCSEFTSFVKLRGRSKVRWQFSVSHRINISNLFTWVNQNLNVGLPVTKSNLRWLFFKHMKVTFHLLSLTDKNKEIGFRCNETFGFDKEGSDWF